MILVDAMHKGSRKWTRGGNKDFCHMSSDQPNQQGLLELQEFAHKIGLADQWLQWGGINRRIPHFDLTYNTRRKALEFGAVAVLQSRELVRRCAWSLEALAARQGKASS